MTIHKGGCHCGKVRFEVEAPPDLSLDDCNCSICQMVGYQHLIVPRSNFKILQGEDQLTTYEFNTGVAKHYFCSHCGVKSFYVPRSHPEGISVNGRCLDQGTVASVTLTPFDGQHWEQNRDNLAPLPD
jgi:hypothetical protein